MMNKILAYEIRVLQLRSQMNSEHARGENVSPYLASDLKYRTRCQDMSATLSYMARKLMGIED